MVQFGDKLQENKVEKWDEFYVDYNKMKKAIKKLTKDQAKIDRLEEELASLRTKRKAAVSKVYSINSDTIGDSPLQSEIHHPNESTALLVDTIAPEFEAVFKAELQKVEDFYNEKVAEFEEQFQLLTSQTSEALGSDISAKIASMKDATQETGVSISTRIRRPSVTRLLPVESKQDGSQLNNDTMESLKRAAVSLHRDMQLLRNFSILNYTACVKILKKYDKSLRCNIGKDSIAPVHDTNCYQFYTATGLMVLTQDVEDFFAAIFCRNNKVVAQTTLMMRKKEEHDTIKCGDVDLGVRLGSLS
jgi:SPX domain protein involved in polyphosphate accumulation